MRRSAYARGQPKGPIAIVGGSVAGLTAAYRLHQAGKTPIVFEASNRWGGRMFTRYEFCKCMFCELGGEFWTSTVILALPFTCLRNVEGLDGLGLSNGKLRLH